MNLCQCCIFLALILTPVSLEKKALENHIDDEPVDKEKALKRMKSSDLKIKKELKARAELKASKNTAETEEKSPTTNAPASTTGSVKI